MAAVNNYMDVIISPSTQNYISTNTMVGVWWNQFSTNFWTADFWLPKGVDWDDLHSTEDFKYPDFQDMFIYPLILSVGVIIIRYLLVDPFILEPLAKAAGVANKRKTPPAPNKSLEEMYLSYGTTPPRGAMLEAAQGLLMSERQIERWLHRRYKSTFFTKYDKFMDCGFHFISHTVMFLLGIVIMYNKPWLLDIDLCWRDYPHQSISSDLWWYYMICLSYYWASSFMQMLSIGGKTSDAVQMMLHHFFTILLMVFSWACNFVRIGTLVLMVHECVDVPLLAAKMYKHAGIEAPTDILFVIFTFMWICTRCYLYPFWILRSVFFEAPNILGIPSVVLFKALLVGLLVLNAIWTVLIAGIIVRKFKRGSLDDIRSDIETSDEDDNNLRLKDD